MSELYRQKDRAASFGSIAEVYDRVRPTYPDALVRDLLSVVPRDVADVLDVLDVGCGTGRAAMLFAAQGARVLGVEPDPAMAEVARGHGIDVEVAGFEQWDDAGRSFDLLISGQAWHWVEPGAGARKAVTVLRPGGRVGLFWNMDSMPPDQRALLDSVYEPIAPQLISRNRNYGGRNAPRTPVVNALDAAGLHDIAECDYAWQRSYAPDEYVDLVSTFSDHILLPAGQRDRLFAALHTALEPAGGVVVDYECHLVSAVAPAVAP